jgi:hypothetical protein
LAFLANELAFLANELGQLISDSREADSYRRLYLGCLRAADYLNTRP